MNEPYSITREFAAGQFSARIRQGGGIVFEFDDFGGHILLQSLGQAGQILPRALAEFKVMVHPILHLRWLAENRPR